MRSCVGGEVVDTSRFLYASRFLPTPPNLSRAWSCEEEENENWRCGFFLSWVNSKCLATSTVTPFSWLEDSSSGPEQSVFRCKVLLMTILTWAEVVELAGWEGGVLQRQLGHQKTPLGACHHRSKRTPPRKPAENNLCQRGHFVSGCFFRQAFGLI